MIKMRNPSTGYMKETTHKNIISNCLKQRKNLQNKEKEKTIFYADEQG